MSTEGAGATFEREEPLPAGLRDAYLARARLIRVKRKDSVIRQDEESTGVYLIRSGRVQVSLVSRHGREVILREMGPDMIFGEISAVDGQPRSATVVAREDSVLAHMRREDFLAFLGAVPEAGLWMSQLLVTRIRDLTTRAFELITLPAAARIHKELLRLAENSGLESDRLEIRDMPTHAELAARIGTHREGVTRELNLLASEGIFRQSREKAEILSVAKLRSVFERMSK